MAFPGKIDSSAARIEVPSDTTAMVKADGCHFLYGTILPQLLVSGTALRSLQNNNQRGRTMRHSRLVAASVIAMIWCAAPAFATQYAIVNFIGATADGTAADFQFDLQTGDEEFFSNGQLEQILGGQISYPVYWPYTTLPITQETYTIGDQTDTLDISSGTGLVFVTIYPGASPSWLIGNVSFSSPGIPYTDSESDFFTAFQADGTGTGNYFGENVTFTSMSVVDSIGAPGVPEPRIWAMLLAGFALIGAMLRRRRHIFQCHRNHSLG